MVSLHNQSPQLGEKKMNSKTEWVSTKPFKDNKGFWFYTIANGNNSSPMMCKSKTTHKIVLEKIKKTLARLNSIDASKPNLLK